MGIEKTIDQNHPDVLRERIANLEQALTKAESKHVQFMVEGGPVVMASDYNRLEAELATLRQEKAALEQEIAKLNDGTYIQMLVEGARAARDEALAKLALAEQQVAALTKPVTDEEWQQKYWQEDGGMRSFVDAFLRARFVRVAGSRDAARSRSEDGQDGSPLGDAVTNSLLRTDDPARGSRTAGSSKGDAR